MRPGDESPIVAPRWEPAVKPMFFFIFLLPVPKSEPEYVPAPMAIPSSGLSGCPSANDSAPFLRTPRIELLGPCRDNTVDKNGANGSTKTWKHTFHRAARFSIPRYGQQQQPIEQDGLLIYEGMTLTVNPETGVYDLNFTATAPPTTVTVRMQLQFVNEDSKSSNSLFTMSEPIKLTLPPIVIEASAETRHGDGSGTTLKVNHRGFTELFKHTDKSASTDLKNLSKDASTIRINSDWKIIRAGSARFGSGSANADETNR